MELNDRLTIQSLEGGAVIERLEKALQEIMADIGDPNKRPTATRTIDCKIKITPDKDRTILLFDIDVTPKFAGGFSVKSKAFFDEDSCTAVEITPKKQEPELPLQFPKDSKIKVVGGSGE